MKPIRISNEKLKTLTLGSRLYNKGWVCEVIGIDYSKNKVELSKLFRPKNKGGKI